VKFTASADKRLELLPVFGFLKAIAKRKDVCDNVIVYDIF